MQCREITGTTVLVMEEVHENTGAEMYKNLDNSGQTRLWHTSVTMRTDASIQRVTTIVVGRPNTYVDYRRRSLRLEMPRTSQQRILINDLNYHQHKIQITQELPLRDYQKRIYFCCLRKMNAL